MSSVLSTPYNPLSSNVSEPVADELPIIAKDYAVLRCCRHAESVKTIWGYLSQYFKREHGENNLPSEEALLRKTYRLVHRLEERGLIECLNAAEKPQLWLTTRKGFDLLSSTQNSNSVKSVGKRSFYAVPRRCGPERHSAIYGCLDVKMLNGARREQLQNLFDDYLGELEEKLIVLAKKDEVNIYYEDGGRTRVLDYNHPNYLFLPYETRFNSDPKYKRNLFIYHALWNEAKKKYHRAVHLVLTTDPKLFRNIWEANRHFSIAFNRFMSFLKKRLRLDRRPAYLSVYEYTTSGLLHAHVIIFGKGFLLPHRVITKEWERCGQGSYNFIYSLVNHKGKWTYARKKPKNLKREQTAEDYLVKYLHKSKHDAGLLYWVFNKRYFTYSRKLYSGPFKDMEGYNISESEKATLYEFLFCCFTWDIPDMLLHEDHFFIPRGMQRERSGG